MAYRFSNLCLREVVNIEDGRCLGTVEDVLLDTQTGKIHGIILPNERWFGNHRQIPFSCIVLIGVDVVLVNLGLVSAGSDKV